MIQTPQNIDRLVREVLAEIVGSGANESSPATKEISTCAALSESMDKLKQSPTVANTELVLSARLVTMAAINGKLAGLSRLIVEPRAIVTPAVVDILRQKNIILSRESSPGKSASTNINLFIVAARAKINPDGLANILRKEGFEVQCSVTDCLLAGTDQLAAELKKKDTLGLLLTPHTAAAICLANRLAGIRAVLGQKSNNVQDEIAAVGANLLVIDPESLSFFKLSRMAGDYCRAGIRHCPNIFAERLK